MHDIYDTIDLFNLKRKQSTQYWYTLKTSKFKQNRRRKLKVSHCKKIKNK